MNNLEQKVDQKIQQHMEKLQATQADKATQEEHSQRLEQVTKTLGTLVDQIKMLLNQQSRPTPKNGVGKS